MRGNPQRVTIKLQTFRNSSLVLMAGPITVICCLLLCVRQSKTVLDNYIVTCFFVWYVEGLCFKHSRPWVYLVKWELFSQVLKDKRLVEKQNQFTFCNYYRKCNWKKQQRPAFKILPTEQKQCFFFSVLNGRGNYRVT